MESYHMDDDDDESETGVKYSPVKTQQSQAKGRGQKKSNAGSKVKATAPIAATKRDKSTTVSTAGMKHSASTAVEECSDAPVPPKAKTMASSNARNKSTTYTIVKNGVATPCINHTIDHTLATVHTSTITDCQSVTADHTSIPANANDMSYIAATGNTTAAQHVSANLNCAPPTDGHNKITNRERSDTCTVAREKSLAPTLLSTAPLSTKPALLTKPASLIMLAGATTLLRTTTMSTGAIPAAPTATCPQCTVQEVIDSFPPSKLTISHSDHIGPTLSTPELVVPQTPSKEPGNPVLVLLH
ncbi:hypothetical protein C0989_004727 [Termitomyces sp. Mn162]|nr:hypothetical protein C0989_004727 [Termitomyces sp. Mn162]